MTISSPQIAVVDDDPAVLKALSRLLRSRNFHVHAYGSGQEFLASLANGLPACLIVDFQMPEMNGLELQQHLLSKGFGEGDLVASLRKPVQERALFSAIDSAIDGPAQI